MNKDPMDKKHIGFSFHTSKDTFMNITYNFSALYLPSIILFYGSLYHHAFFIVNNVKVFTLSKQLV